MTLLDTMLSKLTDAFTKNKESNIGKLFSIVATQFDDITNALDRMEEWRDIDLAQGKALDHIGEYIVGEYRSKDDDEYYRLRIKARIIANFLSNGDIASINQLFQLFFDKSFISVQEMWAIQDPIIEKEPAAILITTKSHKYIPFLTTLFQHVGGVSVNWHVILESAVTIVRSITQAKSDDFIFSGELYCGPEYGLNTFGKSLLHGISVVNHCAGGSHAFNYTDGYAGDITDSVAGAVIEYTINALKEDVVSVEQFTFAGEESKGLVYNHRFDVQEMNTAGEGDAIVSGDFVESAGFVQTEELEAGQQLNTSLMDYAYAGDKYAGEE